MREGFFGWEIDMDEVGGTFRAEVGFAGASGDAVTRTGKFFEVGKEFVDRNGVRFSISADEADERIARFTPKAINLQHIPTIFDGLLGQVRRLWREGVDICAEFEIPRWLHDLTCGEPLKVSSEWDLITKEPVAAALVLKPALQDAVIRAVFSAKAGPGSQDRGNNIQDQEKNPNTMPETITLLDRIRALLSKAGLPTDDGEPGAQFATGPAPNRADVEALAQKVAQLSAESRLAEAAAFADQMVRDRRAVPAERPALIAAYARAAEDDAVHGGTVQFASSTGADVAMSRVDTLRAIYSARPDHALTAELLRDTIALAAANSQELTALFAQQTTPDPDAERPLDEPRRRALHRMTTLGQSVVERRS
jgi:hypothetical protein